MAGLLGLLRFDCDFGERETRTMSYLAYILSFCGIKGERNLQEKASISIHLFPTMKFTLLALLATAATTAYATAIEAREPAIADGVRTCSLYID